MYKECPKKTCTAHPTSVEETQQPEGVHAYSGNKKTVTESEESPVAKRWISWCIAGTCFVFSRWNRIERYHTITKVAETAAEYAARQEVGTH